MPWAILCTVLLPGQRLDMVGVAPLIKDKAIDWNAVSDELNERGAKIVISRRATPIKFDADIDRWCYLIEILLCKIR